MPADAAFCPSCGSPVQREAPKTYSEVRQRDLAGPLFGGVVSWAIWWAYFLCGLGALLVLLGIHNARSGKDSGPITGGVVVLAIGIIAILAWNYSLSSWWPLVLIAIGLVVIASALLAHKITRR